MVTLLLLPFLSVGRSSSVNRKWPMIIIRNEEEDDDDHNTEIICRKG